MRNLGSSYRIYPDIADSFADFVALSATCAELGSEARGCLCFRVYRHGYYSKARGLVFPLRLGVEGVKALQPIDSLKNSNDVTLRNKKDTVADIEKW